ncbi:hypothetical protein Vadar_028880 [Vaccinium darrowii]|uniref:Uncharacterized protein n=1 Tax=Vaccinium darrowii TaxID=229202 RepID=A0ACB7ZH52_9ERIC|nr:hypothetical protein Vadar_028880 [Vaccinium darrowii]
MTHDFLQQQQQQQVLPSSSTSSCHVVLTFIIPVLINLIQLKYQESQTSPFETHPKSMGIAVVGLLLYCLAYDAETRVASLPVGRRRSTYEWIPARAMVVFGLLSVTSLASTLFPDSMGPILYFVCVLFAAGDQVLRLWKLLLWKIRGRQQTILLT